MGRRLAFLAVMLIVVAPAWADEQGGFAGKLFQGLVENTGRIWAQRDTLMGKVSEQQEQALGRAAGALLLGAAPPVADPRVQRYVNRVGKWLALHTERSGLQWRFAVIDETAVNAFATPGGGILVTRGLFMVLRDEAELAGVLAHEMSHVLARHHVQAMVARARLDLAADIALDAAELDGPLPEALLSASRSVYARGLDRGDELESDRMGTIIAARAGYDPFGLYHVLQTLEAAGQDPELLGFFLSTHPGPAERLEALDRLALPELDSPGHVAPRQSLAAMQARLAR